VINGQLKEHPLAELVREAGVARVTGALRLERERVKVVTYFETGQIVFATSNLRAHRLGEVLKRTRALTPEQLAGIEDSKSWNNDAALETALLNEGLVWPSGMEKLKLQQVSDVLRTALLWTEGEWKYEPRVRLAEQVRMKIDPRPLLIECARRLPRPFILSRFPVPAETFSPSDLTENGLGLQPAEAFLLSRIDGPMVRGELTALSGLRDAEALRVAYGLALAGLLERSKWPVAFGHSAANEPDDAVGEESEEQKKEIAAGVKRRQDRDLEMMLARVTRADDYYEVLDVGRNANMDEIKRAYHKLARNYHPDKFHMSASPEMHARVETAFARFAHAYEVLSDLAQRSVYDAKLANEDGARRVAQQAGQSSQGTFAPLPSTGKSAKPDSPEKSRAELRFQQGLAALQQEKHTVAVRCFAEAVQLVPGEARYRAHYGSALIAQPQGRRLAEAELQAAIALDPTNASYHVMLARLFRELGFGRRSQGELEKALALEPNNEAARALLGTGQ